MSMKRNIDARERQSLNRMYTILLIGSVVITALDIGRSQSATELSYFVVIPVYTLLAALVATLYLEIIWLAVTLAAIAGAFFAYRYRVDSDEVVCALGIAAGTASIGCAVLYARRHWRRLLRTIRVQLSPQILWVRAHIGMLVCVGVALAVSVLAVTSYDYFFMPYGDVHCMQESTPEWLKLATISTLEGHYEVTSCYVIGSDGIYTDDWELDVKLPKGTSWSQEILTPYPGHDAVPVGTEEVTISARVSLRRSNKAVKLPALVGMQGVVRYPSPMSGPYVRNFTNNTRRFCRPLIMLSSHDYERWTKARSRQDLLRGCIMLVWIGFGLVLAVRFPKKTEGATRR